MKKQVKEQADIKLSIEQWPFFEKQPHPVTLIVFFDKRAGVPFFPSDQLHLKSHFHKGVTNPVNPLVGAEIINNRYDDLFQAGV